MPQFHTRVTTADGTKKDVVANSKEELLEAAEAVKTDRKPVSPDIADPSQGNVVVDEFEGRELGHTSNDHPNNG